MILTSFAVGFYFGWIVCVLYFIYLLVFVAPKLRTYGLPGPPLESYLFGHIRGLKQGRGHIYLHETVQKYGSTCQLWLPLARMVKGTECGT